MSFCSIESDSRSVYVPKIVYHNLSTVEGKFDCAWLIQIAKEKQLPFPNW